MLEFAVLLGYILAIIWRNKKSKSYTIDIIFFFENEQIYMQCMCLEFDKSPQTIIAIFVIWENEKSIPPLNVMVTSTEWSLERSVWEENILAYNVSCELDESTLSKLWRSSASRAASTRWVVTPKTRNNKNNLLHIHKTWFLLLLTNEKKRTLWNLKSSNLKNTN